jgi:hypothetical protein
MSADPVSEAAVEKFVKDLSSAIRTTFDNDVPIGWQIIIVEEAVRLFRAALGEQREDVEAPLPCTVPGHEKAER